MNSIFLIVILIGSRLELLSTLDECPLPKGCRLQKINKIIDTFGNSRIVSKLNTGMRCDFYKGYKFQVNMSQMKNETNFKKKCKLSVDNSYPVIEIRWHKGDRSMLDKTMNISAMFVLFNEFYPESYILNMIGIKSFDLDLIDFNNFMFDVNIDQIYCLSCRIVFYFNQTQLRT
jgi:hypothetical protein